MKKITLLIVSFLMISCNTVSTYYQIYKTKSETVKTLDNNISFFEDNNCKIEYNLWANYGNAGFTFYNKTNENIYLLLDESFYVINDKAYDYFQNRIFTNSNLVSSLSAKTVATSKIGVLSTGFSTSKVITNSSSSAIAVTEAKIIVIPPKALKSISEFDINQTIYRDCDMLRFPSSKQTSSKTFSEATTPLKFYNSITYKIGNNDTKIKVKNDFYVSEISNYSENEIFQLEKNIYCNKWDGTRSWVLKNMSTNQFYIKYIKYEGASQKY